MALHLHRAARTDLLADGLADLLATPPADPFATELVLVPARGVERWLSQRLAHRLGRTSGDDGVCAAVTFGSPRALIAELIGGAAGADVDPWSPEAMTWPLLAVIDAALDEPWYRTLAVHLGHRQPESGGGPDEAELRRGRRYAVSRRLAGLFASYAAQRPHLLQEWEAGRDSDGVGGELDADLHWQPRLWRALLAARVGVESPTVRHATTIVRLKHSAQDLPQRISLFGHTRLPVADLELLGALAVHHDLHLWLPHPSDAMWQALKQAQRPARLGISGPIERQADRGHQLIGHPLLATLGRDLRELQANLAGVMADTALADSHLSDPQSSATLLGWLQEDLRANRIGPTKRKHDPSDRSVQVHNCHGAARQIDVLREVLLGLLTDDPTLEPRDILVMCPDIESYAPLIAAGFGLGELDADGHPAHQLRVRLADRALTQTNALLGVAGQLLELAGGRNTASEVLNFATAAPVRARFGFTDDDLDTITAWTRESGVRWGFDSAARAPFELGNVVQNTWRFGMDRILAGVAMSDDSHAWLGVTLPLDDVGSNQVELAGRFAEFADRLGRAVTALSGTRPLSEWLDILQNGVAALTLADGADEAWQFGQLQREFASIASDSGEYRDTELRLADARVLLGDHLAGRPTRANFRTGTLTVCTMVPMRSVPHRVVCLVGLDDGVFPRSGLPDGDDVLARTPMTGDRDLGAEDRQLLLDAICAATETLVITYTGHNEHTGAAKPPAVPLLELLDTLDRTTTAPVRDAVVVQHPLQPFDIRNVIPGDLIPGQPFTFDATALVAARTAHGTRPPRPAFVAEPLPNPAPADVSLAELSAFLRDPVRGFFRALDYTLPWDVDGIADAMPVEIDALQQWGVGDRMLRDILRGMAPEDAAQAEWRRGMLPPGRLGWRTAKDIRDQAAELARTAAYYRTGQARSFDVDVDLGDGRRLAGTVGGVYGHRLVSVTYSKLAGKHLMAGWVSLLALSAGVPMQPGQSPWEAMSIGRAGRGGRHIAQRLLTMPGDSLKVLRDLVDLYDAGRREPLPLPVKTSYAWAEARHSGGDPDHAAERAWRTGNYPGEDADVAYAKVWGERAPLSVLTTELRSDEEPGERHRLGAYAARLWLPLLQAEGPVS